MKRRLKKPPDDRARFWRFCVFSAVNARTRAKAGGFPCTITASMIDVLLVDQNWCCAISGIKMVPAASPIHRAQDVGNADLAWAPSLDRINPPLGYVPGNVRVVCRIVNFAMNAWGPESLKHLVRTMAGRSHPAVERVLRRYENSTGTTRNRIPLSRGVSD